MARRAMSLGETHFLQETLMNQRPSEVVRQGWSQNAYARDKVGDECTLQDEDATKFCLAGAIYHCYPPAIATEVLRKVFVNLPPIKGKKYARTIAEWNDYRGRTKLQVVELLVSLEL